MSNFANPTKAYVWLDGDAFRGLPGASLPEDPFAETLEGFDAYGGIEAGFELTAEQGIEKKKIFNKRDSVYKVVREVVEEGMKFRSVDNTKASLLTRAQGGKVTKKGDLYIVSKGMGEEFSLLTRLEDGTARTAFWCARCTLAGPAARAAIDGQNIDGWEFDIVFLAPLLEVIPALPEGMSTS